MGGCFQDVGFAKGVVGRLDLGGSGEFDGDDLVG